MSYDYETRNPLKNVDVRTIEKAIASAISELAGYKFECSLAQIKFDDSNKQGIIRDVRLYEPAETIVKSTRNGAGS